MAPAQSPRGTEPAELADDLLGGPPREDQDKTVEIPDRTVPVDRPAARPGPPPGPPPGAPPAGGPGVRPLPIAAAACVVLLAIGILGGLLLGGDTMSGSAHPAPGATPRDTGVLTGIVLHAARDDTSCGDHSYGDVRQFFAATPCQRLHRALYGADAGGRPVVVSVSTVHMPDAAAAGRLRELVDTNGTGNVSDLLREGVRLPSGPPSLTGAGYGSELRGAIVVIAEADFTDPSVGDPELLDEASRSALALAGA